MDSRLERNELFCGLLDVLNVAIGHKLLNEAESVLDGLRALKPRMTELDTFEAWIAMRRGKVKDAIRLLQHVEAAATRNQITPFAKALLSFCLYSVGDPTWRSSAQQVIDDDENIAATGLVRLLFPETAAQLDTEVEAAAHDKLPPVPAYAPAGMGAFLRA
jgi:type III secretion protein HrpB1